MPVGKGANMNITTRLAVALGFAIASAAALVVPNSVLAQTTNSQEAAFADAERMANTLLNDPNTDPNLKAQLRDMLRQARQSRQDLSSGFVGDAPLGSARTVRNVPRPPVNNESAPESVDRPCGGAHGCAVSAQ